MEEKWVNIILTLIMCSYNRKGAIQVIHVFFFLKLQGEGEPQCILYSVLNVFVCQRFNTKCAHPTGKKLNEGAQRKLAYHSSKNRQIFISCSRHIWRFELDSSSESSSSLLAVTLLQSAWWRCGFLPNPEFVSRRTKQTLPFGGSVCWT